MDAVADGDGDGDGDDEGDWYRSGETDADGVCAGEVDGDSGVDKSALPDPVVVTAVSSRGVALVVVAVVVVVWPFLCPLSLDLSLDLSLGLLVPTGRRETWISPFASAPVISPLPSSSPFPLSFSSPLLLSSPRFFFPLPLPLPALEVTVSSLLLADWVVVSDSTRTQASPLDEVISGAGLEAVDVCASEFSALLVLSVVIELLEAARVDARRVGDTSLAGAEFSLVGPLNHELPQENKPAEDIKKKRRKEGSQEESNNCRQRG